MRKGVPLTLIGIPTRDRPEYLCALLCTILFQTHREFDVVVVDTSSDKGKLQQNPHLQRLQRTFIALNHGLEIEHVEVVGRSEAVAVNRILLKAQVEGYGYVYKIDDDHVLPPTGLERLHDALDIATSSYRGPHLISAVTPWMHQVFENAAAPEDRVFDISEIRAPMTDVYLRPKHDAKVAEQGWRHEIDLRHFRKYGQHGLIQTKLASAANFLMKPDTSVLWSDVGHSSLFADAIWFLQLQRFLGYALWFEPGTWAWHVAAPSGGVREEEDEHDKFGPWDQARRRQLDLLLEQSGKLGERGLSEAEEIDP